MNRAINVHIRAGKYAGTSYTLGGKKAGRFWSNEKATASTVARRKNKSTHRLPSLRTIYKAFQIAFFVGLGLIAIYQPPKENPITYSQPAEASEDINPNWQKFESADMPAYTDEFDIYFGDKANEARRVAECEANRSIKSKRNRNGTYDYGHMQVNTIWLKYYGLTEAQVLDKAINIQTAKKIYDRTGDWSAWSSSFYCHKLS